MGSEEAMDDLQEKELLKTGKPLEQTVDVTDSCKFRFGNGDTKKTESRANVTIQADKKKGKYQIYVLNTNGKYVPLLGSIKMLAGAGAIIDFKTGRALFTDVCGDQVLQLERASSGHLLLDITGDIVENHRVDDEAARATLVALRDK